MDDLDDDDWTFWDDDDVKEVPHIESKKETVPLQSLDNKRKSFQKENYYKADIKNWMRNKIPVGDLVMISGEILDTSENSELSFIELAIDGNWDHRLVIQLDTALYLENIVIEDDWITVYGKCLGRTDYDHDTPLINPNH